MRGISPSSSAFPHQPLSPQPAAQSTGDKKVASVSDKLTHLLKETNVKSTLEKLESLKFVDNVNEKLNFSDELFHVKTPDGRRFTVAGQRSPGKPCHIYVRIPHTEELKEFALVQSGRDADWEFIYTLPEYYFSSENKLVLRSPAEVERIERESYVKQDASADRLEVKGKQALPSGVGSREVSPIPTGLRHVNVKLKPDAPSGSELESDDADENDAGPYTRKSLDLLRKYNLPREEDGSVKLPGAGSKTYTNPRETNRFTLREAILADLMGASAGTMQSITRNPLLNLPGSFEKLNKKLFNQSTIHIVSAGAGLTALGTAVYMVFEPNGTLRRRTPPLDGSAYTQPAYKFTFIDPAGDFGGLAYQIGKGCLGGSASGATKTNTPLSHLHLAVLDISSRDFLKEKIATLKASKKEKVRADLASRSSNEDLFRTVQILGKRGHSPAGTIRSDVNPSDLEKTEALLRSNFDSAVGRKVDRQRVKYKNYSVGVGGNKFTHFHEASAKDKANSRKIWEGQSERALVREYGMWVIEKLRAAKIEINFVKGKVTACEVDDALNAIYTYTSDDENGSERKTTIKGDLGMISIGQGPLKAPPQVQHLPKEYILTYDELIADAWNVVDLIDNHPGPDTDEAVRAYGQKWLGLKLGILGTGIAFEEVEPVLETMTKICRRYEEQRGLKLLPDREMDFLKNGSFAFSRNGLTHELKREDTFFLRFGVSEGKTPGKPAELSVEKFMTEKEIEYRIRLGEIFKEGQTVDVVEEFQKIIDEIKETPTQIAKEKALRDACLTFAFLKTSNAWKAGYDDLNKDDPYHPWRIDMAECVLRLNRDFLSYLEKSSVPTINANVDRTNRMRKYDRIIAAGADYRLPLGEDKKIVLTHKGGEIRGIDKIVICGGRKNYDKAGRDGGIKFPDTKTVGSDKDPSLQSMDVEVGYFPKNPEGEVLPFIMATSAWMPLAALTGSDLYGAKGALAAYKDSAKVSLGRAAESGTVAGALINISRNDDVVGVEFSHHNDEKTLSDIELDTDPALRELRELENLGDIDPDDLDVLFKSGF